jgi:hypothetical protein
MKRLLFTSFGILIALIGFIAILHFLPCRGECYGSEGHCAVEGKHGEGHGCEGKSGCEGKGHGCEAKGSCGHKGDGCGDGHGEMHKEMHTGMHGDAACGHGGMDKACGHGHGEMDAACGGHGKLEGAKCMMPEMEMSCGPMMGCCCCCAMMHGGMMEKNIRVMIDSAGKKDSVVIIRK